MSIIKAGTARQDHSAPGDPLGPFRAILISDTAGLTRFGAFIEVLAPGARSSLPHWHAEEDEMVLLLSGELTVIEDGVETLLLPGDAACWKAGVPVAHCMRNHAAEPARYVVVGNRAPRDVVTYPHHDRVLHVNRTEGTRRYTTLAGEDAGPPKAGKAAPDNPDSPDPA